MKESNTLPYPIHVIWHITNNCNMHCLYCFTNSTFKGEKFKVNAEKIIERINNSPYVKRISIIGGEPLLVSNLDEIIGAIKNNIFIQIDSNLTNTPSSLFKYNNVSFSTTLDGHTKELHEKTRANFQKTVDNIRLCVSKKKNVKVNVVVNRFNVDYLHEIASFISGLGVVRFSFSKCKDFNSHIKLAPNRSDERIVEDIEKIISDFKNCNISLSGFYTHNYLKKHENLPSCFCGLYKITIDPQGNLYPCELIPFFKTKFRNFPPNVNSYSLEEAMQTELFREFRKATVKYLPLGCENCKYKMKCSHGCRFISYLNTGSLYGKNISCNLIKIDIYDVFGFELFLPSSTYTKKRIRVLKPFFKKHEYIFKDKNVLDIGCAGGQFTFYVEDMAKNIVGIDIKKDYITYANILRREKKSKARFFHTDFENIDFSKFDTVMLIGNVLPHFQVKKFIKLVAKLKQVKYFLIEFSNASLNDNFDGEYKLGNQIIKEESYKKGNFIIRKIHNKSNNLSAEIKQYAWSKQKVKSLIPFELLDEKEEKNNVLLLYKVKE